jgi:glycosyltransferase involved in cell wall biosynthesis
MKIVIDARELRTSSGRYVERLLHYIQQIDDTNQYEILVKSKDISGWKPTRPNFNKVSCLAKEFSFGEQLKLRKQIKSLKADLVHFAFPQQPIWYKGKTVTTIHDLTTLRFNNPDKNIYLFKFKQKVYSFVIKRAVRKASRVFVPSNFVKEDLVKFTGIKPSKVLVTYEAADPITENSESFSNLVNQKFIMYVGRPTPHKNLDRLIESFVLLKKTHPDLELVLAGKLDSNYRRIQSMVQTQDIKDVLFTDFIREGQLKWLYENCQAYVFPSLSEGFGLPGLEAMLCGAPVVSSNATCLPEIYADAAIYFDPLDVISVANKISEVLDDNLLRDRLAEKGRARAAEYSWMRMARQTLDVYNEVLSE